ncbi:hypothetical protein [uncultured Clostridium sp.]|uniref:hypothetical protein n=1 Tax=uncultured Clostridium sp. TaxID=59620 RepID=UPI0028EDC32B|nr:hypothetical protein [uncultured Clostridium sp.]
MKRLIRSELERVINRPKTKVSFILLILITVLWGKLMGGWNVGFYDQNNTTTLNSLNFSMFILRDIHLPLMFIILPMLYGDALSEEKATGCYRNIATRPYKRWQFIAAKLISQIIVTFIIISSLFIISSICGNFFVQKVEYTTFMNQEKIFYFKDALIYGIKFYFMEFIIISALLSVMSMVASIIPNAILCILGTIGIFVGGIYVSDNFILFLSSSENIFKILNGVASNNIYIILFSTIVIPTIISIFLWVKKDWLF